MSEETKTEEEAVNRSVIESFKSARIPSRYYRMDMRLADCGPTFADVASNFTEFAQAYMAGGEVCFVFGDSAESTDGFNLIARGAVLSGVPTRILNTADLLSGMEEYAFRDVLNEMTYGDDIRLLGLTGFMDNQYMLAYDAKLRYRLDYWLQEWMKEGRSLLLEATNYAAGVWSPKLVNLLRRSGYAAGVPQKDLSLR